ncbi:VOC family protein [Tsukamurella pulmonis]|uniref:VOC family protein n=1 Tax=Tsukamurella pulmonis TaxID=47312 RepID=UPI003C749F76
MGLAFEREQHDGGPVHYAATLPGGSVVELYPASDRPVTRTRLGFEVPDQAATADALRRSGFTVKRQSLAVDPDGNRVELHERP